MKKDHRPGFAPAVLAAEMEIEDEFGFNVSSFPLGVPVRVHAQTHEALAHVMAQIGPPPSVTVFEHAVHKLPDNSYDPQDLPKAVHREQQSVGKIANGHGATVTGAIQDGDTEIVTLALSVRLSREHARTLRRIAIMQGDTYQRFIEYMREELAQELEHRFDVTALGLDEHDPVGRDHEFAEVKPAEGSAMALALNVLGETMKKEASKREVLAHFEAQGIGSMSPLGRAMSKAQEADAEANKAGAAMAQFFNQRNASAGLQSPLANAKPVQLRAG